MFFQRVRDWVKKKDASFFFYFGGRLSAGVFDIFTIKYVVEFLSREQFGEWGFLGIMGAVMVPLLTLSLPQAMMRMYFDHSKDDVAAQQSLVTSVGLTTLLGMLLLAVGAPLLWLIGAQPGVTALFVSTVVTARLAVTYFNYLTLTRNDYGLFFFSKMVESAVYLGAVGWAVHAEGAVGAGTDRLAWLTLCQAITLWVVALTSAGYYVRKGQISLRAKLYSSAKYRELLHYSLPLIPTFFLGWVLSSSDVWILRRLSTLAETADYVFAVRIVSVVGLVQQSAIVDWPRFYYGQMRDNKADRDRVIARRMHVFLLLHAATIGIVRLIERYAYHLLGASEFTNGLEYLGYLLLGNYFFLIANMLTSGLGYAKKTRLVLLVFLIPAVLNFGINLLLVPHYGARAAALTTLGAYALFALGALVFGRSYYRFQGLGIAFAITGLAAFLALV
ncbi:MAG TPA: lipopolysaccharide biosynthesis protein [Polyangiaceae bacterium]|nr:lipopolysaccharide biosynthesis protein [Polyangiaceae bacterium]